MINIYKKSILKRNTSSVLFTIIFFLISSFTSFGASTTYTYDDLHRLSSVTQENCTSTTYTYDEAGNRTVKEVKQIDTTPPETSCTLDGTAGSNSWYTSNVTATLSVSDAGCGIASTLYSTDAGSKWQAIKKPFKVMIADEGEKKLLYKSSDYGSNSETEKSKTVKIDKTAPDISISSPLTDGKYTSKDTIALTVVITDAVSGIDSKTVTLDGKTDVTGKSLLGTLSGGTHKIILTAKDKAGNTSTKTVSFTVDGSSPPEKAPDLTGKMIYLKQICKKKKKGMKCTIKGKVKITNEGNKKAGRSFVKLFISDDASYDNEDTLLREVKCKKIKQGKKLKRYFKYKFPLNSDATGKYVIAVIDGNEKVKEADETNNEVTYGPVK